jgi:hypothetical protein
MEVALAVDLEFDFNLVLRSDLGSWEDEGEGKHTSQFVAVKGTLENSHPSCEGRSEVSRMYLFPHQYTCPLARN